MATEGAPVNNQTTDYAGGEQFNSPEELEKYLSGAGNPNPDKDGEEDDETGKQPVDKTKKGGQQQQQQQAADAGGEEGEGEGEEDNNDEEFEYPSLVHYFNDRFKLNLNTKNLPEEIDIKQEAEVIGEIFERTLQGVNAKLSEYQRIDEILKDKEVTDFIKAKAEGKTMKDFAAQYAQSYQGLPADKVATQYLKTLNPTMTDEDVQDMINNYREKNKLDKLEADARKYFQEDEVRKAQLKEQQEKEELRKLKEESEKDIREFTTYVKGIKDIAGVSLDDKMKGEIVAAATTVVDQKTGMTWLDRALLTDEGVFLATAGILHMKRLLNGKQTRHVNKGRNNLFESLFETPEKLQSSSGGAGQQKDFDANVANQF